MRRRSAYISGNLISQTGYDTDGRENLKQAPTLAGPLEKMVYDGEERQVRREGVGGEAVFVSDGMGELALELAANSTGAGAAAME